MIRPETIRARRLALAQQIAAGGLPEPWQLARAGLPPLVRASELAASTPDQDTERARYAAEKLRRYAGPTF